jgi:hypothetical protein
VVHSTAALAVRQPHLLLRDAYARCVAFRCVSLCLVIRSRANDSRTKRVQDRDTARSALAVTQHVAFRSGSGVRIDSTRRAKERSAVTMNRKRRDVVDESLREKPRACTAHDKTCGVAECGEGFRTSRRDERYVPHCRL